MMQKFSLCGLGTSAPNPVLTTILYFRDEYEAHIRDKKCPAGVCKPLFHYEIDADACTGCHVCFREVPAGGDQPATRKSRTPSTRRSASSAASATTPASLTRSISARSKRGKGIHDHFQAQRTDGPGRRGPVHPAGGREIRGGHPDPVPPQGAGPGRHVPAVHRGGLRRPPDPLRHLLQLPDLGRDGGQDRHGDRSRGPQADRRTASGPLPGGRRCCRNWRRVRDRKAAIPDRRTTPASSAACARACASASGPTPSR